MPRSFSPVLAALALLASAPATALTPIDATLLTQDTVWGPGAPVNPDTVYVLGTDLVVDEGFTLTIQAGTTVKMAPGASITVGAGTTGTLIVAGTAGQPALLVPESGAPGSWDGVTLTAKATDCQVVHATLRGAVVGLTVDGTDELTLTASLLDQHTTAALRLTDASIQVTGTTFANNGGVGVDVTDALTLPVWAGNTVGPNGSWHVQAHPNAVAPIAAGTTWVTNQVPAKWNAIRVLGGSSLAHTATWPALGPGMAYAVGTGGLTIGGPEVPLLTLQPGAVVKLDPMNGMTGTHLVVGHATDPDAQGGLVATGVVFTSVRDDSIAGDTGGDGATAPAPGDWGGITFLKYALDQSGLAGGEVRFGGGVQGTNVYGSNNGPLGGGAQYGGVTLSDTPVALDGVTVRDALTAGVLMHGGTLSLTDTTVRTSGGDGVRQIAGGPVTVDGCTFLDNAGTGLFAITADVVGSTFQGNGLWPVSLTAPSIAALVAPASGNVFVPRPDGKRRAIEVREGVIATDALWPALPDGFSYLVASGHRVFVQGDPMATLTLEGAVVKLGANDGMNGTYLVIGSANAPAARGTLHADGATITAASDDSVGGDSLGDGPVAPVAGSYGGVVLMKEGGASTLTATTIRYAGATQATNVYGSNNGPLGAGGAYGGLTIAGVSPLVEDAEIADAGGHGVHIHAGSPSLAGVTVRRPGGHGVYAASADPVTLSGCLLEDAAGYGLFATLAAMTGTTIQRSAEAPVSVTAPSVAGIAAAASGNTFVPSTAGKKDAIEAREGVIATDATWPALPPGFAYLVPSGHRVLVQGDPAPTLTLMPGAVIKLGPNEGMNGTYLVVGSSTVATAQGILNATDAVITSSKDDAVAGDTTGDGPTTPARGSHGGIVLLGAAASASVIEGCALRYGGAVQATNVYGSHNSPIASGASYGQVTVQGADPHLTGVQIKESGQAAVRVHSGSPHLLACNLSDGDGYGVHGSGAELLYVESCALTGHASGGLIAKGAVVKGSWFAGNGGPPVTVEAPSVALIADPASDNTFQPLPNKKHHAIRITGGVVVGNPTWPARPDGLVYLVDGGVVLPVQSDFTATLTIEPGAVVKFGPNVGQSGTYLLIGHPTDPTKRGRLTAVGVTFTSALDDAAGGDSNGDGASIPSPGQWGGLILAEMAADDSSLLGCDVRYAGAFQASNVYGQSNNPYGPGDQGAILLSGCDASIADTVITDAGRYGLWLRDSNALIEGVTVLGAGLHALVQAGAGEPLVVDSVFTGAGDEGVRIAGATLLGCTLDLAGKWPARASASAVGALVAPASGNTIAVRQSPPTYNAIVVDGGAITQDDAWPALPAGMSYLIPDGTVLQIGGLASPTLTIGPGAVVKLGPNAGQSGTYLLAGSPTDPTKLGALVATGSTFTSSFDDSVAGDTLADGATTPATQLWGGVVLSKFAAASSVQGCTFRYGGASQATNVYGGSNGPYGGGDSHGALTVDAVAAVFGGNRFESCRTGLAVIAGTPAFEGTALLSNVVGMRVKGGAPTLHGSNVVGNTELGVKNEGPQVVDATQCWWGSGTGPTHASNPNGTGDGVSDAVLFDPWSTTSSDVEAPAMVTDLRVVSVGPSSVTLAWTAPGGDGALGQAATYDLRFDTQPITAQTFAAASQVTGEPAPGPAGAPQTMTVPGLAGATTWTFALRSADGVPNLSPVSNNTDSGPPVVLIVSPPAAQTGAAVALELEGKRFFPGAQAALVAGGVEVPILVTGSTFGTLSGTADLTGAAVGAWDVRVTNADSKAGALVGGFAVQAEPVVTEGVVPAGPHVVVAGDTLQFGTVGPFVPAGWSSLDPTVGTVDGDGLFTAVSAGTKTTTAVVATDAGGKILQSGLITVPLDADGDGMKDSWELTQGLDPHDPADAAGDLDSDTVTNGEEAAWGSDPHAFNPSLRVDSTPGGAWVFVDGGPVFPGRPAGAVAALAAVDTAPTAHTYAIVKKGQATLHGAATTSLDAPVTPVVALAPHQTPAAYLDGGALEVSVTGPASPLPIDWDRDGDLDLVVGDGAGQLHLMRADVGVLTDEGVILAGATPITVPVAADPLLVDWDGDGDPDLLLPDGATVRVYENVGAADAPAFDPAWASLQAMGPLGVPVDVTLAAPARLVPVDWDGDGDRDLVAGVPGGVLQLWLNEGTDASPALGAATPVSGVFGFPKTGLEAAPWLVPDLDGDGRMDLVAGDASGEVRLWLHQTLSAAPTFAQAPTQVVTTGSAGRVVPAHLDWDGDGVGDLLVGTEGGALALLRGVATIAPPTGVQGVGTPDFAVIGWAPSPERGLAGYRVRRASQAGGPYGLVGFVPVGTSYFTDVDVVQGEPHWYVVSALSGLGESEASAEVQATAEAIAALAIAPAAPQTVVHGGTVDFDVTGGFPPYTWLLLDAAAGSIDADGVFTATAGDADRTTAVLVLDALSNAALSGALTVPADFDQDGLRDAWEAGWGFDPTVANGQGDPDDDGLSNLDEQAQGTNPTEPDTDGDGLEDGWEVDNGLDPLVDDTTADPDGDGLSNVLEHQWGLDPQVSDLDTDHDGDWMSTAWEILNGTDPFTDDAAADPDGDGLPNLVEHEHGLDPQAPLSAMVDTDGDGMPDAFEARYGLSPLLADADLDADGDLIPNGIELLDGTPPGLPNTLLVDEDGDGLPSVWERAYGTDPFVADATADPELDELPHALEYRSGLPPLIDNDTLPDADGDGLPDRYEIALGMDPAVSNAGADGDLDDRPDLLEMTAGASPAIPDAAYPDADGDGMPDFWEQAFAPSLNWKAADPLGNGDFDDIKNLVEWRDGTNPTRQSADTDNDGMADVWEKGWGVSDPAANPDGDLWTNHEEYLDGTNPLKIDPYTPEIWPPHPIVAVGDTLVLGAAKSVAPLTWESSDPTVALIDASGTLTGVALGSVTVTVTDANGQVGETIAFCYPEGGTPGTSLIVTPAAPQTVVAGDTLQLAAQGATGAVTWWVLDPTLGSVDGAGLFTATGTEDPGGDTTTQVVAVDGAGNVALSGLLTVPFDGDADGLPDAWEIAVGLDPAADDAGTDGDGDGLTAAEEWVAGTHPGLWDTDGDRLPDGWEVGHGLNPTADDGAEDPDGDGRDNRREYLMGSDPHVADVPVDADGDGMDDGWELGHGLDPTDPGDADGDLDGDGIRNIGEYRNGTDPGVPEVDTDGDGLPDAWEDFWGLTDPDGDPDGDGRTNLEEARRGRSPIDFDPYELVVSPSALSLAAGETAILLVEGGKEPLAFWSDYDAVATVDGAGTVLAVAPGVTLLRVRDANGVLATVAVSVVAGALVVEPATETTVPVGQTLGLTVAGGTPPYTWATLDPAVGTVDAEGLFTAVGDGAPGEDLVTHVQATDGDLHVATSGAIVVPWDSDGDELPDRWEHQTGLQIGVDDADADPDGDGATNRDEWEAGSHPGKADTDGDGMPDGWELTHGLDPTAGDGAEDPDGDGLDNLREYLNGRDPHVSAAGVDGDGDGMDDVWELLNGLDPTNPADAAEDPDADGIVSGLERRIGTDPRAANDNLPDTDGDWMPDVWEDAVGTDPTQADHAVDADGDGHTAYLEYLLGTDPYGHNGALTDMDADGMPDFWERTYGLDPLVDDGGKDADADGRPNRVEYRDATNPKAADGDVDGDGMGDRWEHGFALTDAVGNPDNDHLTNVEEYQLGKNPVVLDAYAVTVDPSALALIVGDDATLACLNAVGPCTWSSDDPTVATVDAAGAVAAIGPGLALIAARDSNDVKGVAVVAVRAEGLGKPEPIGVQPTAADLSEGGLLPFAVYGGAHPYASIASSDGTVVDVDADVDAGGALVGTGMLVAGRAGEAEVVATDAAGLTAVITVRVVPGVVAVEPTALTLEVGQTAVLRADGGTAPYGWSVADSEVATAHAKTGVVTALAAGTTTVTVTDVYGRAATVAVSVTNPALSLAPDAVTLRVGDSLELTPVGGVPPYTWATSEEGVAAVDGGRVDGRRAGEAVVTVRDAAGQQASATLTVVDAGAAGDEGCRAGGGAPGAGATLALLLLGLLARGTLRRRA